MRNWTAGLVGITIVLSLGACGTGQSAGEDATGDGTRSGEALTFVGNDQLQFSQAPEEASPGRHTIELVIDGSINHNVAFEEVNGGAPVVEADAGQTATATVDLQSGTYTYFCSVPGHRAAGMEGTLVVR